MESPRKEEAVYVFWDIKMCPVPDVCDARRVAPCIKLFLRELGYSGCITITTVGVLTQAPANTLEAVFSTGISLHSGSFGRGDMISRIFRCVRSVRPTVNIMVISIPGNFSLGWLHEYGCNYIHADASILWPKLPLADPEDYKGSETGESAFCVCLVCDDLTCHEFNKFITHLSSRKHEQKLPDWFPPVDASLPKNAKDGIKHKKSIKPKRMKMMPLVNDNI